VASRYEPVTSARTRLRDRVDRTSTTTAGSTWGPSTAPGSDVKHARASHPFPLHKKMQLLVTPIKRRFAERPSGASRIRVVGRRGRSGIGDIDNDGEVDVVSTTQRQSAASRE